MKEIFIAGNWKSNKTGQEAETWIEKFQPPLKGQLVLFVPFTVLPGLKLKNVPFMLGAQNVSAYPDGAYTGEVSARQIKEFADWVLIGHSERRKYFGETDEILARKVELAKAAGLKIIYCVPDEVAPIPVGVEVVAYEPVGAIGTGNPDTPENANNVISAIKAKSRVATAIYGGSVTPENVASFVNQPSIDGVLPGGASLDPAKFAVLITNTQ